MTVVVRELQGQPFYKTPWRQDILDSTEIYCAALTSKCPASLQLSFGPFERIAVIILKPKLQCKFTDETLIFLFFYTSARKQSDLHGKSMTSTI